MPSTADSTEIAGVIMASPKKRQAPPRPITSITVRARPQTGNASESNAIVPPSPWLSARITSTTYLIATTSTTAQKTSDNTPRMAAGSCEEPPAFNDSRSA